MVVNSSPDINLLSSSYSYRSLAPLFSDSLSNQFMAQSLRCMIIWNEQSSRRACACMCIALESTCKHHNDSTLGQTIGPLYTGSIECKHSIFKSLDYIYKYINLITKKGETQISSERSGGRSNCRSASSLRCSISFVILKKG